MKPLVNLKHFKNPSTYYTYRGKRFKKRLMYGIMTGFGFVFYSQFYNTDIRYYFSKTQENVEAIQNCKHLRHGTYKPTTYLFTTFLQAIYGVYESVPYIRYETEHLPTPDGGELILDYAPIHQKYEGLGDELRILIIFHGLTGGSRTNYMSHAALNGYRFGFRTICVNSRGMNEPLKNHIPNNLASTEDLELAIQHIKAKYPKARLYGMGISIGANRLLKYVGQKGKQCPFEAVTLIANPWDVLLCMKNLQQPLNFIYQSQMTKKLKEQVKKSQEQLSKNPSLDLNKVLSSKSLQEFEENYSAKLWGYQSVDDYYRKISCLDDINNVQIPVLAIQSADDPICKEKFIPKEEIKQNENMILAVTPRGGHIDFFTGYKAVRWVYWPCLEFLDYQDKKVDDRKMEFED